MTRRVVDLSHPLDVATPPWPGDPWLGIEAVDAIPAAGGAEDPAAHVNVSALRIGAHLGTHVDAPAHFFREGRTIEAVPLERFVGAALRIGLGVLAPRALISRELLAPHEPAIRRLGRVVLDTGWSARWRQPGYFDAYPALDAGVAAWLVECGVEVVGVDAPSLDYPPHEAHRVLLGAGVLLVENLTNLRALARDEFELIVTPLPLVGVEASPVRAVAVVDGIPVPGV